MVGDEFTSLLFYTPFKLRRDKDNDKDKDNLFWVGDEFTSLFRYTPFKF